MIQSGLLEIFEVFYEKLEKVWPIKSGQFCYVVTPYLNKIPQILEVTNFKLGGKFEGRIRNVRSNDFLPDSFPEPLKHFKFSLTERPLFMKAKKRPVIVISPTYLGYDLLTFLLINQENI